MYEPCVYCIYSFPQKQWGERWKQHPVSNHQYDQRTKTSHGLQGNVLTSPSRVICSVCSESSERYKSVLSEPVFEISASLRSETCALWWSWLTESAVVPAADAVGVEFHSHSFSCAEYQYKHHRGGTAAVIVNRKQRSSEVFVHKVKPFLRLQDRSIDRQTAQKFSNLQTMTVEVHEDVKTLIYALQVSLEVCRTNEAQICNINLKKARFHRAPCFQPAGNVWGFCSFRVKPVRAALNCCACVQWGFQEMWSEA